MNHEFEAEVEAMTTEQAQVILEDLHTHKQEIFTDDVYPWWSKLRLPLFLLSGIICVLCLGIVILAVTLRTIVSDRVRASAESACYELFTVAINGAQANVVSDAVRVGNAGWSSLVGYTEQGEFPADAIEALDSLITSSEAALKNNIKNLAERAAWVADGKPLPCPVEIEGIIEN